MSVVTDPSVVVPEAAGGATSGGALARLRRPLVSNGIGMVVLVAALVLLPVLVSDPTRQRQWAEYLCYAMVAVGVDIAWGYGGMLVLGQGVFFGLGAYAMGMHLSLEQVPKGSLPEFMSLYSDYTKLPWLWRPFQSFWFSVVAAVLLPMLVATVLGLAVFKRRVRGPFFALLTQATALVFSLILIGNLKLTAGFNGLTGFTTIFGRNKYDSGTNTWLYQISAVGLVVVVAIGLVIATGRFGRLLVAVRDGEDRVRFLGYDAALVKTVAFAIAAGMAGFAGAFAAPVIGIVSPNQFSVLPSILMVCWVAVGGRGRIWGAVIGAVLVNWGRTRISESNPDQWVYFQGALFVLVLAFAPGGLVGLYGQLRSALRRRSAPAVAAVEEVPA